MFFLQVDLTGGCAAPRQAEDALKPGQWALISLAAVSLKCGEMIGSQAGILITSGPCQKVELE